MIIETFANNIVAKRLQVQEDITEGIVREKKIIAVLSQHRAFFIKLMESFQSKLTVREEAMSINFCFTHNIGHTPKNEYSEVEISYPKHLSSVVSQCEILLTNLINEMK